MKTSAPFKETAGVLLKNPKVAALYLEECLEGGDVELFKKALKDVAEANLGGVSALSKTTSLNREALYRTLSEKGNPRLDTLTKILDAMGLRIAVTVRKKSAYKRRVLN